MTRTLSLVALAAAIASPAAFAQAPAAPANANPNQNRQPGAVAAPGTAGRPAVSDPLFVQAAAFGGLAEVTLAELGIQRATDPELKKFSQKMADEHTRMNGQLGTLAAQKRMAIPRALDARAAFCTQCLAGLSGEEFDRCYAKAQYLAHMEAVATYEAESERGQDPDIKAFASSSLPHVREHLKTIKPIFMKYDKERSDSDRRTSDSKSKDRTEK